MPDILLTTERLILRRFTADYAENLYELDHDPEVMRFINGGVSTPRDVILHKLLPNFLNYDRRFPGFGFWAVTEKSSKAFLGWLSFRLTGLDPEEITLGFRLRKNALGKGYATEGAQAVIEKGFMKMGVRRVVATTYEDNLASRRVMEKIGMKPVRRFRITIQDLEEADTFHADSSELWEGDDVQYAIEKAEWKQHHGNQCTSSRAVNSRTIS